MPTEKEMRDPLVEKVANAMVVWASENPWCDTQGIASDEWRQMATAAIEAMGFTYEYRAVAREAPLTKWSISKEWVWRMARVGALGTDGWIERRLVGSPERVED